MITTFSHISEGVALAEGQESGILKIRSVVFGIMNNMYKTHEQNIEHFHRPSVEEMMQAETLPDILRLAGVEMEKLDPDLNLRTEMENSESNSVRDAKVAMVWAVKLADSYKDDDTRESLSDAELKRILCGLFYSDIGKTGSDFREGMSEEEKREQVKFFLDIFSVSNVANRDMSMSEFFHTYRSEDAEERLERFASFGLDPNMTLRQFHNLHSHWTFDSLQNSGVPEDAIPPAALHHILEGQNPGKILAYDGEYTRDFNSNLSFGRGEMLVIIMDKLDAIITRGGKKDPVIAGEIAKKLIHSLIDNLQDQQLKALMLFKRAEFDQLLVDVLKVVTQEEKSYAAAA